MKIPFGDIDARTLKFANKNIADVLDSSHLTEGALTAKFERRFASHFGWKHAVATSSGTTAGEVIWAAVRELRGDLDHLGGASAPMEVITPACAFVSTASCILASGATPLFVDIDESLNMDWELTDEKLSGSHSVQFVATMGSLCNLDVIAKLVHSSYEGNLSGLYLVGDLCEAHGAKLHGKLPNQYLDAAIYSLYPAHLVVGVEGGVICTDDDKIAELCRSVKSHGRPAGSNYFSFQRVGFNAKWSDLHAAVALASLEGFEERYEKRRWVRGRLIEALSKFEEEIFLYRDAEGEEISPHAFPVVMRDENRSAEGLYQHLEAHGIECKTLFGSLPTQHDAFRFMGYKFGDFPVAERIGRTGLHFGCGDFMGEEHVAFIASRFEEFFSKK